MARDFKSGSFLKRYEFSYFDKNVTKFTNMFMQKNLQFKLKYILKSIDLGRKKMQIWLSVRILLGFKTF